MTAEPSLPAETNTVTYIVWVRIDAARYPLRIRAGSRTQALESPSQDLHRGEPITYRIGEGCEVVVHWARVATLEVFEARRLRAPHRMLNQPGERGTEGA